MEYQTLLVEEDKGKLVLTINRPQALNALNRMVMRELDYFFSHDAPVRVGIKGIIITGAGEKSFVAGADIKEFLGLTEEEGRSLSKFGQEVFFKIENFPIPVIAVINGFALGGGCELAMACHMRIAEDNARFGQPEVNLGLIPGYGGTQRLLQHISKSKAIELLLTADMVDAQQSLALGLVNYVVPIGEGIEKAGEIIKKIGFKGPIAIAKTIRAVNAFYEKEKNGFEEEYRSFGQLIGSKDSQEGARAFLEKRRAKFTGV